jgi:hypothetical protein
MGGTTKYLRSGNSAAAEVIFSKTSRKMGSTRKETGEPASDEDVKKLVRQDTMQTLVSPRMDLRLSERTARRPQGTTWHPDIRGRLRQFVGFM